MKNLIKSLAILLIAAHLSGCATILGGPVTTAQRTKPDKSKGQPARPLRTGALIADILLGGFVFAGIDFITCAIYKPDGAKKTASTK